METENAGNDIALTVATEKGPSGQSSHDYWAWVILFEGITPPTHEKTNELYSPDSRQHKQWEYLQEQRQELLKKISDPAVGLYVRKRKLNGRLYTLISASSERLEAEAERIALKLPKKIEYGGGYVEFEREKKNLFQLSEDGSHFSQSIRIYLIESILEARPSDGGAGISIYNIQQRGLASKVFALHEPKEQQALIRDWAKTFWKKQPLERVKNYLGPEVAMYFAWIGFYTRWLAYATFFGFIAFAFWLAGESDSDHVNMGVWAQTGYSIFLSIWATLFLEFWKRRQNTLAFNWGQTGFEEEERVRPEFNGVERTGLWVEGMWIEWDSSVSARLTHFPEGKREEGQLLQRPPTTLYASRMMRLIKTALSLPIAGVMITVCVVLTLAILSFRLFVQDYNSFGGAVAGGICNALYIMMMNKVWSFVAYKLTDWENHRTRTSYNDQLILKQFVFQFISSYTSLYYMAFFKNGNRFWNSDNPHLLDSCKNANAGGQIEIGSGCIDELTIQLVTLLLVNMAVGQAQEFVVPWIMFKLKLNKTIKEEATKDIAEWEREAQLSPFAGTAVEYSSKVIQFGYITLFAAAFPIAPILAWINNIVEMRTDAFKFLNSYNRPPYNGCQDIGSWYKILAWLGIIATITNMCLIGFSYQPLYQALNYDSFTTLAVIVIMEHAILVLKYVVSEVIPDVPGHILKKIALERHLAEETVRVANQAKFQITKSWPVASVPNDDGHDDDYEY